MTVGLELVGGVDRGRGVGAEPVLDVRLGGEHLAHRLPDDGLVVDQQHLDGEVVGTHQPPGVGAVVRIFHRYRIRKGRDSAPLEYRSSRAAELE